jgi:hypothetical protein
MDNNENTSNQQVWNGKIRGVGVIAGRAATGANSTQSFPPQSFTRALGEQAPNKWLQPFSWGTGPLPQAVAFKIGASAAELFATNRAAEAAETMGTWKRTCLERGGATTLVKGTLQNWVFVCPGAAATPLDTRVATKEAETATSTLKCLTGVALRTLKPGIRMATAKNNGEQFCEDVLADESSANTVFNSLGFNLLKAKKVEFERSVLLPAIFGAASRWQTKTPLFMTTVGTIFFPTNVPQEILDEAAAMSIKPPRRERDARISFESAAVSFTDAMANAITSELGIPSFKLRWRRENSFGGWAFAAEAAPHKDKVLNGVVLVNVVLPMPAPEPEPRAAEQTEGTPTNGTSTNGQTNEHADDDGQAARGAFGLDDVRLFQPTPWQATTWQPTPLWQETPAERQPPTGERRKYVKPPRPADAPEHGDPRQPPSPQPPAQPARAV